MKNAMKKLMAFALVAVMLVGTLPFAASASGKVTITDQETGATTDAYSMDYYLTHPSRPEGNIILSVGDDGMVKIADAYEKLEASGYNLSLFDVTFKDQNGSALSGDAFNPDYDFSCYMTTKQLAGDTSTTKHEVIFKDYSGKVYTTITVADGSSVSETDNVEEKLALIAADKVTVPAGQEFRGWQNMVTGEPFLSFTAIYGNTFYTPIFTDIEEDDSNNTGSGSTGSGNTGSGNTGSNDNAGSTGGSSSTDTTNQTAYAYIYVGNSNTASTIYSYSQAFSVAAAVNRFDNNDTAKHYAFDYFTLDGGVAQNDDDYAVIQPGHTAHIRVKVTESKLNDNKVYLQIYLNNNFDTPAKTLNVTTMATEDGLNLYGNVEDLILDNYTAKNSKGIKMDGMYEAVGSWVSNFLEDDKVSRVSADEIIEAKEDTFVVYNIMVTNAKTGSSSTADDTNPKTGDQIMVPVAIMAVSASVLAAVAFYLNKKRVY